jgi:hypothetical protein
MYIFDKFPIIHVDTRGVAWRNLGPSLVCDKLLHPKILLLKLKNAYFLHVRELIKMALNHRSYLQTDSSPIGESITTHVMIPTSPSQGEAIVYPGVPFPQIKICARICSEIDKISVTHTLILNHKSNTACVMIYNKL